MILNTVTLNWKSSALTLKPLLHNGRLKDLYYNLKDYYKNALSCFVHFLRGQIITEMVNTRCL